MKRQMIKNRSVSFNNLSWLTGNAVLTSAVKQTCDGIESESETENTNDLELTESPVVSDDYDTDLDLPVVSRKAQRLPTTRQSGAEMYESACRESGVVPHTAIRHGLSQPVLTLRYRSIGPLDIKPLCVALVNNGTVTVLDLEDTGLCHQGALYLAETLRENFAIRHLNIANNNLGDKGTEAVTNCLCHNTTITYLNISGNKLSDLFGRILSRLLQENDAIVRLHANFNCMRQKSAADIGKALSMNSTLQHLDLSWNCFTGQGAIKLFAGLKNNTSLKHLDLSWNGLGYEGGQALSILLRTNCSLEYIDLSNARIIWQNARSLARGLRHNNTLKVFKLGGNLLTTTGAMTLLEAIAKEKNSLQLLDITDVPVVAEFHMLGTAIQTTRHFHFIHGGIVNSHDYSGRQVLGDVGTGKAIKHPMQIVLEFIRQKQIRLLELFRSMDKAVVLKMTDEDFVNRLKKFGLPLYEHDIRGLAKVVSGKGSGKTDITYPKLVKSAADHILRERARKAQTVRLNKSKDDIVHKIRITSLEFETQSLLPTAPKKKLPLLEMENVLQTTNK